MPMPDPFWSLSPSSLSSLSSSALPSSSPPVSSPLANASYRHLSATTISSTTTTITTARTVKYRSSYATLLRKPKSIKIVHPTLREQDDSPSNARQAKSSRRLSAMATEKLRRIGRSMRFWRHCFFIADLPTSRSSGSSSNTPAMRRCPMQTQPAYKTTIVSKPTSSMQSTIHAKYSSYESWASDQPLYLQDDYTTDVSVFYDWYASPNTEKDQFTASFYVDDSIAYSCDNLSMPSHRISRTYSGTCLSNKNHNHTNRLLDAQPSLPPSPLPPSSLPLPLSLSSSSSSSSSSLYSRNRHMSAGAGDRSRQSSRLPPLPPSPKTADCFPGPSSSITQVTSGPSSLPLSMVSSHAVMQSPVVVKPLESRSASSRMSRKESSHTLKSTRNSSQHSSLDINREFTLASPATMSSASNFNEFVQSSLTAGGNKLRKRSTTQMSIHPQHRGISTPILPETPRRSTNTAPCSRNVSIDLVMLSPSDTIASLPVSRHGSVNSAASAHSSRRKSVDTARSTPCSSKRRFRNKSALPAITIKDQHELDRQDQLHYLLRTFLHNNHLAFINTTGNILDIMTGSGVWALEMASEYPACQVHGVDLLPAQPSHVLPPNCHFRLTISMTALPYQNDEFEYLHHRFVALHVPREIQPAYWHECYRVCKHGGIIEVQERNMVMRNVGEIGQQINIWLGSILIHQNGIPLAVQEIANDIKCAGFHILDTQELPVAVGQWAGNMGAAGFAEIRSFLEEHREYLVRLFTLEDGEFDHLLADWQTEINTYRTVWTLQVIIARKI